MHQTKKDYQSTLEASDRAIAFMRQKPFGLNNSVSIFQNQKTIALLMLRRYDECKEALEIGLTMQEYGSFNWFNTMEEKMMLTFHTGAHTEGYDTYLAVTKVKQFKDLKGHSAEMWQMFKVYLHILSALGKTPIVDIKDVNNKGFYKIDKIFNDFDVSNDDKKGMNLTILIAKVVLTIVDKNEKEKDKLEERIEALKKYLVRNISKEDAAGYRANQFIKILAEIPNSGSNQIILERNTHALIEDIASVPYNIVEAAYKVEVMPYDVLWGDLLKTFSSKAVSVTQQR